MRREIIVWQQNGAQNQHIDIGDKLCEDVVTANFVGRALGKGNCVL